MSCMSDPGGGNSIRTYAVWPCLASINHSDFGGVPVFLPPLCPPGHQSFFFLPFDPWDSGAECMSADTRVLR
jgi:hypothetical protein